MLFILLIALLLSQAAPSFSSNVRRINKQLDARKTAQDRPCFTFDELWTLHDEFWTANMYPNNVAQATAINSTLLAPNIIGRVDATRVFPGQELNTEWHVYVVHACESEAASTDLYGTDLFGLFTGQTLNSIAQPLFGVPLDYEIVHFAASEYIVSSATIVTYNFSTYTLPIEIDTFIAYNKDKQISEYDATFRWLEQVLDLQIAQVQAAINATTTQEAVDYYTTVLAKSVCETEVTYCTGANQQYSNASSCYDFLTQDIRFGKAYELSANTLLCRTLHQYMLPYRPDVHCPHVGPSGGDMCVDDLTYAQKVLQPVYTNAPLVPGGKESRNESIAAL